MNIKYKVPKWKSISVKNNKNITLVFDQTEHQIEKYPLIILEQNNYYYYLSFRTIYDEWGTRKKMYSGEIKISPTKNQRTIKEFSYLDTLNIYCMKKESMKLFFDDLSERKIDFLNWEEQQQILKILLKRLSVVLPYCSVLQVNYDLIKETLTPDLIFCHPEIWKATKCEWKEKRWDDIVRIEEKFGYHKSKSRAEEENSDGWRVSNDLDIIMGDIQDMLWEANKQKLRN